MTIEDGQPLSSSLWFRSKYKANLAQDQEVYLATSFGLYIGVLGHKSTFEVSKELDFFRVSLNTFCLDDVHAKTAMPAKFNVARAGMRIPVPGSQMLDTPVAVDSLKQEIRHREIRIEYLERNLKTCREKIQRLEAELAKQTTAQPEPISQAVESLKEISESDLTSAKKKKMTSKARNVFKELEDVADKHRESLASILGHLVCCDKIPEARDLLGEIAAMIARERGVKVAVKVILSEEVFQTCMQSMAVPDWVLLYFKISARLPDNTWQMLLNLTKLGETKVPYS